MKIHLPQNLQQRLQVELSLAKRREVGGILMAEHLDDDEYRIVELTVQRSGGSAACFVRHPKKHRAELDRFFERTGHNYTRFNYFGEWHSHPSFSTMPSAYDVQTMQALASDPTIGAEFLALLVFRLEADSSLSSSATVFRKDASHASADLLLDRNEMGTECALEEAHSAIHELSNRRRRKLLRLPGPKVHVKMGE